MFYRDSNTLVASLKGCELREFETKALKQFFVSWYLEKTEVLKDVKHAESVVYLSVFEYYKSPGQLGYDFMMTQRTPICGTATTSRDNLFTHNSR